MESKAFGGSKESTIFIVDDHPLVREGMKRLIAQDDSLRVVGEAEDVLGALDSIAKVRPDLVIVDLALKGLSGLELIASLRETALQPLTLVLSMYDELAYAERALQAGARGYITKARAVTDIIEAIHSVLDGKLYVSQAVIERVVASLASRSASGPLPTAVLSARELEVFHLLGQGLKPRQISAILHVSTKTVDTHCANIKAKLKLGSAGELLQYAIRWMATGSSG